MAIVCQCGTGAYLSKAGGGVEGGRCWRCQSGAAFGLVVVGFGDSTGFGMSKVVVLRFSMAFRVSKVVGVWIWGGLGCLSFILGFRGMEGGGLTVSTASVR